MTLRDEVLAAVGAAWDDLTARDPEALAGIDADATARDVVLSSVGPVIARSVQQRMTDDLGPYYDTAGLARRWGVSRQAVSKRHTRGELLGLPTADGRLLFPTWQFRPGTDLYPHVVQGIPAVREVLARHNPDPLSHAIWMTSPTFGADRLPAHQALQQPGGLFAVLAAAEADVERLVPTAAVRPRDAATREPMSEPMPPAAESPPAEEGHSSRRNGRRAE